MSSLSPNGLRLARKLVTLPRNWITAAALASAVGVSRRTVLRELTDLEAWMTRQGFRFLRSPGLGLMLDEDDEGRQRLRDLLEGSQESPVLSREERRQKLTLTLFASREPRKIYSLAKSLDISENTLASDLDAIGETLAPWDVVLRRRPGVGVWLEGTPEALRRSLGAQVKTQLYSRELHALFRGTAEADSPLATLFDPATAEKIWVILQEFDREEKLQFSDAHMISLAVHLTLTIRQLRAGKASSVEAGPQADLRQAGRLADRVGRELGVTFTLAEIRDLSLYLDAYGQGNGADSREMNLRYLAIYLIRQISETLDVDLTPYTSLADDLCSHLRPMMLRLQNHVHNENPQLENLKTEYSRLWDATSQACESAHKAGLCPRISEDEAGYLAMHIGAVLEYEDLVNARLDIAVVCPYGLASGKFLASQIQRDFPSIHIAFCGGIQGLDLEALKQQRVDLVVSTVPLNIDFPHLRVNAVLQESDRTLLRAAMDAERQRHRPARAPQPDRRAALRYTAQMSAQILSLLNHVTIQAISSPQNEDIFIQEAAAMFSDGPDQAQELEELLWRRENLGSTYIKPLQVLLLHCRAESVRHCRLGYLAAEPSLRLDGELVRGALVLLAPKTGEVPREVIQAVSALLIEEPRLMEALRRKDTAGAVELLESGLSQRFRDALTMRLL